MFTEETKEELYYSDVILEWHLECMLECNFPDCYDEYELSCFYFPPEDYLTSKWKTLYSRWHILEYIGPYRTI